VESLRRRGAFSLVIFQTDAKSFASSEVYRTEVYKITDLNADAGTFSFKDQKGEAIGEVTSPGIKLRGYYGWQAAVTDTGALRGCGDDNCRYPVEISVRF
jgi:hypothetical protein